MWRRIIPVDHSSVRVSGFGMQSYLDLMTWHTSVEYLSRCHSFKQQASTRLNTRKMDIRLRLEGVKERNSHSNDSQLVHCSFTDTYVLIAIWDEWFCLLRHLLSFLFFLNHIDSCLIISFSSFLPCDLTSLARDVLWSKCELFTAAHMQGYTNCIKGNREELYFNVLLYVWKYTTKKIKGG